MITAQHPEVRLLAESDIDTAVELSTSAGWNQTAADWDMLLRLAPDGCIAIDAGGKLRATATLFSYGRRLGWIGMVLTDPGYRRRGYARTLFEHLLRTADARGIASLKLDATDQGQPLYESLGFRLEQPIARWWRRGDPDTSARQVRGQITESLYNIDEEAFGVERRALLQGLAGRSAVFAAADGFAFLRPGLRASYAGPCVARSAEAARDLMQACIQEAGSSDCFWDLLPRNRAAGQLARELGFEPRRELVRMVRGASCDGREEWIYGIAGFELG
jgi:GNAT superfamily N-acetyltransferase